jgi:peptide deformylase
VKAKGWQARVFQHEIDHLDGRLYIDIATDVWKAKDAEDGDDEELTEAEEHARRSAD